jgi:uncharacterized protein YjiS (DUF1127 family)
MITRPIQVSSNLTREAAVRGADTGYAVRRGLISGRPPQQEAGTRRVLFLIDAGLWLASALKRWGSALRANARMRAAEQQLYRMSNRELSDLGLCRGDIAVAVREGTVRDAATGVMPQVEAFAGYALPANQNMRQAA